MSSVTYWKAIHVPNELDILEKKRLGSRMLLVGVSYFWQCCTRKKKSSKKK